MFISQKVKINLIITRLLW